MSGPFDEKLTDDQREAAALRYIDTEDTGREVARKAAAGELTLRGEPVPAFEIAPSYAAQLGIKMRNKRQGKAATKVADMPHRDAIEVLRRRLISAADTLLADYEKTLERDAANADPERLRQIMRCQLEASRLPGPSDQRPAPATTQQNGKRGAETKGGTAGALLREHRAGQAETAQDTTHHASDSGDSSAAHNSDRSNEAQQRDEPGALPSEQREAAAPMVLSG